MAFACFLRPACLWGNADAMWAMHHSQMEDVLLAWLMAVVAHPTLCSPPTHADVKLPDVKLPDVQLPDVSAASQQAADSLQGLTGGVSQAAAGEGKTCIRKGGCVLLPMLGMQGKGLASRKHPQQDTT